MKKLSILVMAVFAFSVSSYASGEYNVLRSLNNGVALDNVSEYVKANPEQKDKLEDIFYQSAAKLSDALIESDKEAAEHALLFNLANVKHVLSPEQYRKYLTILNDKYNKEYSPFYTEKK